MKDNLVSLEKYRKDKKVELAEQLLIKFDAGSVERLLESLSAYSEIQDEANAYWADLSKEEKLKAFYCITDRLFAATVMTELFDPDDVLKQFFGLNPADAAVMGVTDASQFAVLIDYLKLGNDRMREMVEQEDE